MENKIISPEDVDVLDIRLAQRLAALRTERNWSLDELAQATGISRADVASASVNTLIATSKP